MKVFYELLCQYAWYQKYSDPFSCLLTSRQHDVGHEEIFLYEFAFQSKHKFIRLGETEKVLYKLFVEV